MIIPLIVMVFIFSSLGGILNKEQEKNAAPQPVWLVNEDGGQAAEEAAGFLAKADFQVKTFNDRNEAIAQAKAEKIPAVLVIPQNFSQNIENFKSPKIELYTIVDNFSFLSLNANKSALGAFAVLNKDFSEEWLNRKQSGLSSAAVKSPINLGEHVVIGERQAEAPLAQVTGFIQKQTTFIPIILFLIIVMAVQMVAVAVATERENKTFETLLSLPVNRKTIILAKLVAAGIVAVLAAVFYMYGLSKYMNGMAGGAMAGAGLSSDVLSTLGISFGIGTYVLLGSSLFMGILVALSIAMILGLLADSVKGVQAVTTPLMILVLLPYILTMFLDINKVSPVLKYAILAIPFSHPFLAAQKIITHDYAAIIAGIIYQFVVFLVFVVIATKIFSSDKIITLRLGRKKNQH